MSIQQETALAALDRCDTIATCWEALACLINPDPDALQGAQRDCLAVLCGFLVDEYTQARNTYLAASSD